MNKRQFSKEITKEYLKRLGIEYVSPDGKCVIKNGKPATICVNKRAKRPYSYIGFYDHDTRASVPIEERKHSTGSITLYIHVLNYVWNKADKPEGMVIDHIDNDPTNNYLSNLQCITQQENLIKERGDSNKMIKCNINKPRSFYEEKLAAYEAELEKARKTRNAQLCHNLENRVWETKARLRYWDAHQADHKKLEEVQRLEAERLAAKKQSVKDRRLLVEWKELFREKGNKHMWHQLCQVIYKWDTFEAPQKEHVFEVLHKTFGNPWALD